MCVIIREMIKEDIDSIVNIENASFSVPWTKNAFEEEFNNDLAKYLVLSYDDKIVAYAGFWKIYDEAHITNVAVLPEYRGKKLSKVLMQSMFDLCKKNEITRVTLEVRESNIAAINLYLGIGFENCGKRPKYYTNPTEDAIIMWKGLCDE